tara:strand:+ start:72 stop:1190 length:1119 start_codon:yes stop_codon:yes gene_type:complete
MKKLFIVALMLLLCTSVALAADYSIEEVYVSGIEAEGNTIQVELGSTLQVLVYLEGAGEQDVKVRAWIGGYEYGTIQDITDMFDVEDGISYRKYLYLDIPEDVDSSQEYTLYVEIYDDTDSEMVQYDLYLEDPRHSVTIEDIFLSSSQVEAGDYLGVKVRLQNLGENVEKDIKITVSLEGVSSRVYLEELGAKDSDTDDEVSSETLYLSVPEDLEGDYMLQVEVEYNNGYSTITEYEWIRVAANQSYDEDALVSIASVKDLSVGTESTFKVQVTNLASEGKEFGLFVYGIDSVEYSDSITVSAGRVGELHFSINPVESGIQEVIVEVSSEDGLVEQRVYSVNVDEGLSLWYWIAFILAGIVVLMGVVLYLKR